MKKLPVLLFAILFYLAGNAQQILLLAETFESDTNGSSLTLNAGGPVVNSGNNQWIVNAQYSGSPLYPNTPPEDSIANGGIIYNAPYSHYLHIHNKTAVAQGVSNDNWDTSNASDRFCSIGSPFCTAGLDSVIFTFFWVCQGDSNAYGQVYYSANGGPWIQTGRQKYNNQNKWIYESIQDTAFNNLESLQFGFRWVNPVTTDSSDVSWGIDDIIAVGNYDSISNPTTMSVTLIPPDSVCQGDPLLFNLFLAQPLCDGEYTIEMSNASGNFSTPYNLGTYGDLPGGYTQYLYLQTQGVPADVTGNCFRIRIVRLTPPMITSDTSVCFSIIHCANTIFNESSAVLQFADSACLLSELDVYFNSTGIFGSDNVYVAQMSDSTGNFADSTVLGTLPSSSSYPSIPQGDVTGLISASLPPGCGYYVRVVSTDPPGIVGDTIGPFCLKNCDELTNNHTDIHLCISSGPYPSCDTIHIQPHYWSNSSNYDTCNKWEVQILDMMSLNIINTGFFGVYYDSVGGYFVLCAPGNADSLAFLPMPQWDYYLRIIGTCSSQPWNDTGTIVRITIGAPQPTPLDITVSDSFACNELGSVISLYVSPFNSPTDQYYWSSNLINNGNTFSWMYNPLSITLAPTVPKGTYTFYVKESNNGCFGPNSAPATVTIIGIPTDTIHGPLRVCAGDTAVFNVNFLPKTYYDWTASAGAHVLDPSNVQTRIIFDTVGTYTISCYSLDSCGSYTVSQAIKVVAPFAAQGVGDTTVCAGQPIDLSVQTGEDQRTFLVSDSGTIKQVGGMFNLVAHGDVTIDSFAVRFTSSANVAALIFGKNGTYQGNQQLSGAWSQLVQTTFRTTANEMTVIPGEVNIPLAAGETFAFYITTSNNVDMAFLQGNGILQGVTYASDGVIDFQQGTSNEFPFGSYLAPYVLNTTVYYSTRAGLHYYWSNGDSGQVIQVNPVQSGTYSVFIYDSVACSNHASVPVIVDTVPRVYAGPDTTVCPDSSYVMQATSTTTNVLWQPTYGLSDSTILTPVFNYPDSVLYVLIGTGANGCTSKDSVQIGVVHIILNLPSAGPICSDSSLLIAASTSATQVMWSPPLGLNRTDTINPVFNYSQSVTYLVTVLEKGCSLSDSLKVEVEYCQSHLVAPSAFSPDGNGVNDHFTVFGNNIVTYEIKIFNRWGEEVYYSDDVSQLNQQDQGWDGTYKGKKQDAGTFVYYITAKDVNGKNIELKGNVTLIR